MNTAFSIFWLFVHIWRQSLVLQRTATIGLLAKREGKQMENLVSASQESDQRSKINIMEKNFVLKQLNLKASLLLIVMTFQLRRRQ